MQTKSKYEEMILKEFREIPIASQSQIINMLRSVRKSIRAAKEDTVKDMGSGFCGAWEDDRSAEEIIEDIKSHRSGFGKREIVL